jgi:glycosyltransferase involved in cell wall biosynthesis
MKILHYIDSFRSGGKERQLLELLKGLSRVEDIECELIIMSENVHFLNNSNIMNELNIKPRFLLRKSKKDLGIFFRLYRLCQEIRPDILHSWESMCSVYAMPITKLLGIKFVNGFIRNAPQAISVGDKIWLRRNITFPFSDAVVANSLAGLNAYRVPRHKAYLVPNGFDMSRISNLPQIKTVRERWKIDIDKVVGMVGTFSDYKDYFTFIEAAHSILTQRNDVTFVMVGDGENMQSCKERVLPMHSSKIKFLGKQDKVEEIVSLFSVGVLCSSVNGEGISNAIMEYMVLKKPVVATDCDGNRELVVDGETGYLIPRGNAKELVAKIIQLLDDNDLAQRLGNAGYIRIVDKFTLEKMTLNYVSLYQRVLKH